MYQPLRPLCMRYGRIATNLINFLHCRLCTSPVVCSARLRGEWNMYLIAAMFVIGCVCDRPIRSLLPIFTTTTQNVQFFSFLTLRRMVLYLYSTMHRFCAGLRRGFPIFYRCDRRGCCVWRGQIGVNKNAITGLVVGRRRLELNVSLSWDASSHVCSDQVYDASDTWVRAHVFEVVVRTRAAVLHLVTRKLRACWSPRETQASKVYSSL
jgi:hypothetical protein